MPGADTGFSEGGTAKGGGGGVIAPVGEKLLFEHTTFSATRGVGVITPTTPPLDPPLYMMYALSLAWPV